MGAFAPREALAAEGIVEIRQLAALLLVEPNAFCRCSESLVRAILKFGALVRHRYEHDACFKASLAEFKF